MNIEEELKTILNNFSYQNFMILLEQIDNEKNLSYEAQQMLFSIMKMINDNYIVNGQPGTLGHMLLEQKLINKQRISPSLLLFFFEEQLEKIGVQKIPVEFVPSADYKMCFYTENNGNIQKMFVSLSQFDGIKDVDQYNYELMHCALHEIVHAYQKRCSEYYVNDYERRVGQDYQVMDVFIMNFSNNSTGGNILFHESFVSEQEADNISLNYMIYIASSHPEYFNDELVKNALKEYNERLENEFYSNPYDQFNWLLDHTKNCLINFNQFTDSAKDKINNLRKRSLENKTLSEATNGINHNIFLGEDYFKKNNFCL